MLLVADERDDRLEYRARLSDGATVAAYDVATSDRSDTPDLTLYGRKRANGEALNWMVDDGVCPCGEATVVGGERCSELVLIFGTAGRVRPTCSGDPLVFAISTACAASSGDSSESSESGARESMVEP